MNPLVSVIEYINWVGKKSATNKNRLEVITPKFFLATLNKRYVLSMLNDTLKTLTANVKYPKIKYMTATM
jgi:hypothetical protein